MTEIVDDTKDAFKVQFLKLIVEGDAEKRVEPTPRLICERLTDACLEINSKEKYIYCRTLSPAQVHFWFVGLT